ncbi:MAG TPA: FeoB-associated Cys-rich membrane protein [Chryseolinea sp.]
MIQEVIVGIVFAGAVFYVGQLVYRSLQSKSACTTGCGKCGALDIQKIEAQIKKKGL